MSLFLTNSLLSHLKTKEKLRPEKTLGCPEIVGIIKGFSTFVNKVVIAEPAVFQWS
jgi:hypothetical protein